MPYYQHTMQHKAIKLMASKLAVAGIIEGSFSEEGLAAMSECEDMTTMMAKELMLGIKDSVEDVSAMFKRMALLKPQASAWSIFSEKPQKKDESMLSVHTAAKPAVEFTFEAPTLAPAPITAPIFDAPAQNTAEKEKPKATRRKKTAENSEDQLLLFKIA